jgi:hypothetical protein
MTTPMSHEELSELVAAYALDAVDSDEARLVEEHLNVCPRCRAELAEHCEVTALLAHTGAPAPEGVWERIAASLDEAPEMPMGDILSFSPRSRRGAPPAVPAPAAARTMRMPWLAAAAAAVVIALLGVQVARQDQQLSDLRAQVSPNGIAVEADQALRDPDAELVELSSSSGELRVRAVIDGDGRGYLLAHNLPELGRDKTYQLWGVGATETPVSLGLLGSDPTTASFTVVGGVRALAITAEAAPGVVVSAEEPVVVGELT